jgi:catechol 2,3-dioxygenase-like lactoylglutathione lyase family enzyme
MFVKSKQKSNGRHASVGFVVVAVFCFVASCLTYAASEEGGDNVDLKSVNPKVYGIQTNVTDLDEAVGFYEALDFTLVSRDYFPRVAPMMNGNTLLVLHRVEKETPTDPNGARTSLNMAVKSLDAIIDTLAKQGIEIIHEEPQVAAIGIWKAIRDPFGNIINLIEHNHDVGNLEKPKVNNVSIVGTDIDRAVHFYSNVLGLDIFSVKYYPVIPLSVEGAVTNIALHAIAEKIVEKVYPDGTQTFLVFEVSDLSAAMDYLMNKGVEFLHDMPQQAAPGIYVAFKDPFGLVHELLELNK